MKILNSRMPGKRKTKEAKHKEQHKNKDKA